MFGIGCAWRGAPRVTLFTESMPSTEERYCAWFGDERDGILYFGQSPFWWASRERGDSQADLERSGPQRIGRFDLRQKALMPALAISEEAPCGIWDVLAHPNGRVYFTTFFETSGYVEPDSGRVRRFGPETVGLNELVAGREGLILASRYGGPTGSVVLLDEEGGIVDEFALAEPPGQRVAAKSLAYDPVRREFWVNTDLLPESGGPPRHDARVLDGSGLEILRFDEPEIQFMTFGADGTGYLAEVEGSRLALRTLSPDRRAAREGSVVVLDTTFPSQLDFVQELHLAPDGSVVVTRWSGRIHRVGPGDEVRSYALPRTDPEGLYYTGVIGGGRLCATLCADVTVVCRELEPEPGAGPSVQAVGRPRPNRRQRR